MVYMSLGWIMVITTYVTPKLVLEVHYYVTDIISNDTILHITQISARDLDLWSDNGRNIEVLEPLGMYPPRFTIRYKHKVTTDIYTLCYFNELPYM